MCLPINVSAIADGVGIKSIKWKCEVYMQKNPCFPFFARFTASSFSLFLNNPNLKCLETGKAVVLLLLLLCIE